MQRTIKTFLVEDVQKFKDQLLVWSQQFETVLWLDSNNYKQQYTSFDAALAVEEFTSIKTARQIRFAMEEVSKPKVKSSDIESSRFRSCDIRLGE